MEPYGILRRIIGGNFAGNIRWWHFILVPIAAVFPLIDRIDGLFSYDLRLQAGYLDLILWIVGGFVITMVWDLSDETPGTPGLLAQIVLIPVMGTVLYLYSDTLNPQAAKPNPQLENLKAPVGGNPVVQPENASEPKFRNDIVQEIDL